MVKANHALSNSAQDVIGARDRKQDGMRPGVRKQVDIREGGTGADPEFF